MPDGALLEDGLLFCIGAGIRLPNEMEMSARVWCAASFFCTHGPLDQGEIEQRQLQDALCRATVMLRRPLGGFPVEEPLARTQIKEGELWGTERGAREARMADRSQMLVIILQLDAVPGKRHGLVLDLERTLIDPHRDRRFRQSPLAVELPILEPQASILVEVTGVAGGEQDTVEELHRVHGAGV